ncbi:MAG: aldehyde dehydrogenase family protein [Candidatus Dormibacteria bacterium]
MPSTTLPAASAHHDRLFAGGVWRRPAGGGSIDVVDPARDEVVTRVAAAGAADVDAAVDAAAEAQPAWAALGAETRARHLAALREGLAARQEEIAAAITSEMGCPIRTSRTIQSGLPLTVIDSLVALAPGVDAVEEIGNSRVLPHPAGVVAAITPWNYPLHQSIAKIAPALLAGCTVVHKPSEMAPLSAWIFAEVCQAAGLPAGVYNMVCGTGAAAGEPLVSHPRVDMVSFTGSTRAGRRVAELAAATVTRVALELGGKSANVILDDADMEAAVKVGVANCLLNAGQTCTAWTRMIVPASRYDELVERAASAAATFVPADPTDAATRLGPLASAAHRERVRGFVERALRDGARAVCGGDDSAMPRPGQWYPATVLADADPNCEIAQEEVFGPVLVILPAGDDDEAVAIANATRYGLAGGVWSADLDRAMRVAARMHCGQVDINGARFNPAAPFGGVGESGYGRELGRHGVAEFTVLKSVQLP